MIDSNTILYIIYIFGAFTLYHTYKNNFEIFLLTSLLMLGALWCYLYVNEFIDKWEKKLDMIEKTLGDKISFFMNKIGNVKEFAQQIPKEIMARQNIQQPENFDNYSRGH